MYAKTHLLKENYMDATEARRITDQFYNSPDGAVGIAVRECIAEIKAAAEKGYCAVNVSTYFAPLGSHARPMVIKKLEALGYKIEQKSDTDPRGEGGGSSIIVNW
jgi:hypothetical protein